MFPEWLRYLSVPLTVLPSPASERTRFRTPSIAFLRAQQPEEPSLESAALGCLRSPSAVWLVADNSRRFPREYIRLFPEAYPRVLVFGLRLVQAWDRGEGNSSRPECVRLFPPGGGPGCLEPRRGRLTQGSRGCGDSGGDGGGGDGGRDWVSRWRRRGHEERGGCVEPGSKPNVGRCSLRGGDGVSEAWRSPPAPGRGASGHDPGSGHFRRPGEGGRFGVHKSQASPVCKQAMFAPWAPPFALGFRGNPPTTKRVQTYTARGRGDSRPS